MIFKIVIQIYKFIKIKNNNHKIYYNKNSRIIIQKCYLMIVISLKNKSYFKNKYNNNKRKRKINKIEIILISLYLN